MVLGLRLNMKLYLFGFLELRNLLARITFLQKLMRQTCRFYFVENRFLTIYGLKRKLCLSNLINILYLNTHLEAYLQNI